MERETKVGKDKKTCFVIAPIGADGSDTRKRSDKILKFVIIPAVRECGYDDPARADMLSEPGMITSQIIQRIIDDSLVVADLTEHNPNVFYELAIRHAFHKPLVQLIRKGDKIPFDVSGMRTIEVDELDLESVDEAKKEIGRQITALENGTAINESPISVAIQLDQLRRSGSVEQHSLADLLTMMSELRATVVTVFDRINAKLTGIEKPIFDSIQRAKAVEDFSRYLAHTDLTLLNETGGGLGSIGAGLIGADQPGKLNLKASPPIKK